MRYVIGAVFFLLILAFIRYWPKVEEAMDINEWWDRE